MTVDRIAALHPDHDALSVHIAELQAAVVAIQRGGVDAVIVSDGPAPHVYTVASADRPYRLIIQEMNEGAATVSDRGVVLYANPCLARMVGRVPVELIGSSVEDLVAPPFRAALADLLALRPGHHGRAEIQLAEAHGAHGDPDSGLPVAVAASCLDLEGMAVHCLILSDLSGQKRNERALEARVLERTAELEVANARLRDANDELESFSYSVSHDLRAPLRAVESFAQILLEEHAGGLDDEGQRLVGVLAEQADRMRQLIDDILALSRIGRAGLRADLVDMHELATLVASELCERAAPRQVDVVIDDLDPAWGASNLVRQVWVNLLENAFKFTASTERPIVTVTSERQGDLVVYRVQDNGAGFDPLYGERLFGVFQRLHGSEYPGTGIGLAIVKRIVTRHGGWVSGEGAVGKGATFTFALPAVPPRESWP